MLRTLLAFVDGCWARRAKRLTRAMLIALAAALAFERR